MNRMLVFGRVAVVVMGVLAGYSLLPAKSLLAQKQPYDTKHGQAPVWETPIPAPPLPARERTLWPNQPDHATYWSIQDIHKAHQVLADAETAGKTMEPNTALHDFPYWTRTHSMFIYHSPRKPIPNSTKA